MQAPDSFVETIERYLNENTWSFGQFVHYGYKKTIYRAIADSIYDANEGEDVVKYIGKLNAITDQIKERFPLFESFQFYITMYLKEKGWDSVRLTATGYPKGFYEGMVKKLEPFKWKRGTTIRNFLKNDETTKLDYPDINAVEARLNEEDFSPMHFTDLNQTGKRILDKVIDELASGISIAKIDKIILDERRVAGGKKKTTFRKIEQRSGRKRLKKRSLKKRSLKKLSARKRSCRSFRNQ